MRTMIALITIAMLFSSASFIIAERGNYDKREIVDPGIILQGGDTFEDAFPIAQLPFSSTGTTCGYNEDYDVMCPYGAWAPDVVYVYTPTEDHAIRINLCNGSDYDTKLMVFEDYYSNLAACNDDYCTSPNFPYPYVSYLGRVPLQAYHDYYIVVSGYGDECGDYVMEIDIIEPCSECPPGGYAEGEPDCSGWYIDNYNGGCGSDPIVFQDIQIGDTICGLTGTINPSPFTDRDWYEVEVSYPCSLFWNVVSYDLEVMAQVFDAGSGDCNDHVQLASDWGTYCDTIQLSASVEPGTYWMVARPLNDWISQPCPQEYVAWLDAYPICGDISMTPDDYPIEVMPGGSFGYTGHLGN
ncbi:MAG: hypothetical protein GF315_01850, partial [candidate division Zixibacteria bacterium]|nr:hypothetical protein [candidate division Zixibacteria bacterium]